MALTVASHLYLRHRKRCSKSLLAKHPKVGESVKPVVVDTFSTVGRTNPDHPDDARKWKVFHVNTFLVLADVFVIL